MNNFYEKYRGIINLIIICVVIVFVKTFILTDKKSSKVSQEIKDDLIGTVEQAVEMLDEAQKKPDFEKYKFENEGLIKDPSNNHEKELIFLTQGLQKFLKEDAIYTQKYQKNSLNIDDLFEIKVLQINN